MNATVRRSRPAPIRARATGSIRTRVRLSTAYTTMVTLTPLSMIGTAIMPNAIHTSRETKPLACSRKTTSAGPRRPAAAPNANPPQNAATNPFPPTVTAPR